MKNARLHNKTTKSRPDRGQNLEAEAKEKILAYRPLWPRGLKLTVYYPALKMTRPCFCVCRLSSSVRNVLWLNGAS